MTAADNQESETGGSPRRSPRGRAELHREPRFPRRFRIAPCRPSVLGLRVPAPSREGRRSRSVIVARYVRRRKPRWHRAGTHKSAELGETLVLSRSAMETYMCGLGRRGLIKNCGYGGAAEHRAMRASGRRSGCHSFRLRWMRTMTRRQSRPREPFAAIPASQLATARLRRLSGAALRVLLVAHAAWGPRRGAVLPVVYDRRAARRSPRTISAAIRELIDAGLLTELQPARAPRRTGGKGTAAVFDVVGRRPGSAHRIFERGDQRLDGAFRITCANLRRLAAAITGEEARILVCLILACSRDRHGGPQAPIEVALSGQICAATLPAMAERSARRAIAGLAGKGLLRVLLEASGRRPAVYAPTRLAASTVSRRRPPGAPPSPVGMVPTRVTHVAGKPAPGDPQTGLRPLAPPADDTHPTALPAIRVTMTQVCRPSGTYQTTNGCETNVNLAAAHEPLSAAERWGW